MTWYWWPIGWLVLIGVLYGIRHYWRGYPGITWLDLVTLPTWVALWATAGLSFGQGYFFWLVLGWLILGWLLSYRLIRRGWPLKTFFHRYFHWGALVAATALVAVTVAAAFLIK